MPWPDEQPVPGKSAPAKTRKNSSNRGRQPGRVERSKETCVHDGRPRFEAEVQSLQSLHNRPAAGKKQNVANPENSKVLRWPRISRDVATMEKIEPDAPRTGHGISYELAPAIGRRGMCPARHFFCCGKAQMSAAVPPLDNGNPSPLTALRLSASENSPACCTPPVVRWSGGRHYIGRPCPMGGNTPTPELPTTERRQAATLPQWAQERAAPAPTRLNDMGAMEDRAVEARRRLF
jgi:hypothetical protein